MEPIKIRFDNTIPRKERENLKARINEILIQKPDISKEEAYQIIEAIFQEFGFSSQRFGLME